MNEPWFLGEENIECHMGQSRGLSRNTEVPGALVYVALPSIYWTVKLELAPVGEYKSHVLIWATYAE